jgi:hypothetical protein
MKQEEARDKKFDVMWSELYVVCKGLAVLEDRYWTASPMLPRATSHRARDVHIS